MKLFRYVINVDYRNPWKIKNIFEKEFDNVKYSFDNKYYDVGNRSYFTYEDNMPHKFPYEDWDRDDCYCYVIQCSDNKVTIDKEKTKKILNDFYLEDLNSIIKNCQKTIKQFEK